DIDAWSQTNSDRNDTVRESEWYAHRQNLPPDDPEAIAAQRTLAHADTPAASHGDALGRTFLTIENDGATLLETRFVLDIQNNRLAVVDARGNRIEETTFDMRGHAIYVKSGDAGEHWTLLDVGSKPIRTWDGIGRAVQRTYDRLRRSSHVYVQD